MRLLYVLKMSNSQYWYIVLIALIAIAAIVAMVYCIKNLLNALKLEEDERSGRYWYLTLITLCITASVTYLVLHIFPKQLNAGSKRIEYLSKVQTETLFTLMEKLPDAAPGGTTAVSSSSPAAKTSSAGATTGTPAASPPLAPGTSTPAIKANTAAAVTATRSIGTATVVVDASKEKIIHYFKIAYPDVEIDTAFMNTFAATVYEYSFSELKVILPKYPIQLRSYFWLYQNWVYSEIIFWCIFGVLANLLYYSSETLRDGKFLRREIYAQFAKVVYSPFCVVIIYICYNKIQSSEVEGEIQYSIYSIVISFLLGFFSGRMIELLGRLKDVFLPSGHTAASAQASSTSQAQQNSQDDDDAVYDESLTNKPQPLG